MFEEFAVDPALVTEWEFFKELRDKFGVFEGRFIADYPHKEWKKAVSELLEKRAHGPNPVRNSATIVEWLRSPGGSRDLRIARRKRLYRCCESWLANAEQQSESFHAILSAKQTTAENGICMQETTSLAGEPLFRIECQPRVRRIPEQILAVAKPLLRMAKRVKWIDRFLAAFDEDGRLRCKLQTVVAFLDWLGKDNIAISQLELHLEEPSRGSRDVLAQEIQSRVQGHLTSTTKLSIHWWAASEGENIHPRFLLTDIGGLQFDHGTDPGSGTTIVHLLKEQRWKDEWSRYTPESSNLTHHGEVSLFRSELPIQYEER